MAAGVPLGYSPLGYSPLGWVRWFGVPRYYNDRFASTNLGVWAIQGVLATNFLNKFVSG